MQMKISFKIFKFNTKYGKTLMPKHLLRIGQYLLEVLAEPTAGSDKSNAFPAGDQRIFLFISPKHCFTPLYCTNSLSVIQLTATTQPAPSNESAISHCLSLSLTNTGYHHPISIYRCCFGLILCFFNDEFVHCQ